MRHLAWLPASLLICWLPLTALGQDQFSFALNLADPQITEYKGPCYAHWEPVYHPEELILLLPGKGYQPTFYSDFLIQGGVLGFHSLGLKYVDDPALEIQAACGNSSDGTCFVDARQEALTGEDLSSQISISRTNSIEHRLIVALQYLDEVFPGNGWDAFLGQDSIIAWSRIRVIGHEEGAGYAAALAQDHPLARVTLMGWADWDESNDQVPAWLADPKATSPANWYGFAHEQDERIPFAHQTATWAALGLDAFGAVVSVDANAHPYGDSHQLSTQATPDQMNNAFNDAVVVSAFTPKSNGSPQFLDAWSYLMDGSTAVGLAENTEEFPLRLFPQPASDQVFVEGNFSSIVEILAVGMDGRSWRVPFHQPFPQRLDLNLASLGDGIYVLHIQNQEGVMVQQKLVVQR